MEKTLILLKHDSVSRGLVGEIISRFEKTGLKIIAMKMILPDEHLAKNHYFVDEEWARNVFEKTKAGYEKDNKPFPYKEPMELGNQIQSWNMKFLREGPVIALVLEGPHSIEIVRKMVGSTEPKSSPPGTIRGDYAMIESYAVADSKSRVLRNLIHASDSVKSADREIALWFKSSEIQSYSKDLDRHF
ncbi:MAG: nucleoside-diphosphate kinase [Candidatus Pacearchaeota archaeon]